MRMPCPNKVICPDENDSPIQNLSAEAPDVEHFFKFGSTEPWFRPHLRNPPDMPTWAFCNATEAEAHGIPIAIFNEICVHNRNNILGRDDPPLGGGGNNNRLFFSTEQTCTVPCPDGSTFTYTTPFALVVSNQNQENADAMAHSYACRIARLRKTCINDLKAFGCVNQPYHSTTQATGGTPPYTYDIVGGALPPGLFPKTALNGDFLLEGTPYLAGNYFFTLEATDSVGNSILRGFNLAILQVANAIPSATVGQFYSYTLVTTGGNGPYHFSIMSGALPDGLSMSQFGTITGVPATAESVDFTVRVIDDNGFACNFELQMTANAANCPDWSQLLWGVPFTSTTGAATVSFTPNATTGATVNSVGDCPNNVGDHCLAQNQGALSYNNTGCNCNLHAAIAISALPANVNCTIIVQVNAVTVATVSTQVSGTFDAPFTLANTGGVPVNIVVTCQFVLNTFAGLGTHDTFNVVATLSNV